MGLVAELSNGTKQPLMSHLIRPLIFMKRACLDKHTGYPLSQLTSPLAIRATRASFHADHIAGIVDFVAEYYTGFFGSADLRFVCQFPSE